MVLEEFGIEANRLGFDEEPQYGVLKYILEKRLFEMNCIPDKYFSFMQEFNYIGRPILEND